MLKYIIVSCMLFVGSCTRDISLLTSPHNQVARNFRGFDITCAVVREWKLNGKEVCWCSAPPDKSYNGVYSVLFVNMPNSYCDPNVSANNL